MLSDELLSRKSSVYWFVLSATVMLYIIVLYSSLTWHGPCVLMYIAQF